MPYTFRSLTHQLRNITQFYIVSQGILDQALLSTLSFVSMVIIGRSVGVADFGAFTLAYTIVLFGTTLQASLVTQPHNVLAAPLSEADYRNFTSSAACFQLGITLISVGVTLLFLFLPLPPFKSVKDYILVLSLTLAASQFHEFPRRVLYTSRRLNTVLLLDGLLTLTVLIALGGLAQTGNLTGPIALLAFAFGYGGSAIVGWAKIRTDLKGKIQWQHFFSCWNFGKWLVGGQIASWIWSQGYLFLVAAVVDTSAAGFLRTAQVLFGPLNSAQNALDIILPTTYSHTLATYGYSELKRIVSTTYKLLTPLFGIACVVVAVGAEPIVTILFGASFSGATSVVALYAVYFFVTYLYRVVSAATKALRRTRAEFMGNLVAAVISLVVGWTLVDIWADSGAIVGMTLGAAIVNIFIWRAFLVE